MGIYVVNYECLLVRGHLTQEAKMQSVRIYFAFLFACTIAATIALGSAVQATSPSYPFPWENENSVKALLAQQTGQAVVCEGIVARIAARNNPPYFVLRDEWRVNNEPESRIAVMCRPPLNLTGVVRVTGTLGWLPNDEVCILDPTVEGLFDQQGQPVYWAPFPGLMTAGNWQALPIPTGPIPPSDPSLIDDGMGIPGEVSAYAIEGVSQFDTVASLLATAPPVLSRIALTCKPVVNVGEGFIVVGDDSDNSMVKVYTNAEVKLTDRVVALSGVAHSEDGRLVVYAGAGPSPFYDFQGTGGSVSWVCGVRWHTERSWHKHAVKRRYVCWR